MKPEEQRIAIAEACGWTFHPPRYNEGPFSAEFKAEALACWVRPGNMQHQTEYPPDYLKDLNSIHEAEMLNLRSLSAVERYRVALREVLDKKFAVESDITACSAHRSEALLKALSLWRE